MKIRRAKISESKAISDLMQKDLKLIKSKEYSKKQIKSMQQYGSYENVKKYVKNWNVLIALENKKIVGTATHEKKLIFSIYTAKSDNFIGSRIGNKLLDFIEKKAQKSKMKKISVISMPTTRYFFEKRGYKVSERLLLKGPDGVNFPEFRLEKTLKC